MGLSILIVEDHVDCAQSLAELLSLYGHKVQISSCATEALRDSESELPDVVLLDIGLPDMNGWELAKRMKSLPKPPVIIAVTSYGQEEDRRRSKEVGIHLHLVKPVNPALLAGMLKRIGMTVTLTESPS
jgi:two-component system OmpR family response regulator